jgi:hypothetical protein
MLVIRLPTRAGRCDTGDDADAADGGDSPIKAFLAAAIHAAAAQLPILLVGPDGTGSHLKAAIAQIADIKCTVPGLYNGFQLAWLLRGASAVENPLPKMDVEEIERHETTLRDCDTNHANEARYQTDTVSLAVEALVVRLVSLQCSDCSAAAMASPAPTPSPLL